MSNRKRIYMIDARRGDNLHGGLSFIYNHAKLRPILRLRRKNVQFLFAGKPVLCRIVRGNMRNELLLQPFKLQARIKAFERRRPAYRRYLAYRRLFDR